MSFVESSTALVYASSAPDGEICQGDHDKQQQGHQPHHVQADYHGQYVDHLAGHHRHQHPVGIFERCIEEIALFSIEQIAHLSLVDARFTALHLGYQHVQHIIVVAHQILIEEAFEASALYGMGDETAIVVDDETLSLQAEEL